VLPDIRLAILILDSAGWLEPHASIPRAPTPLPFDKEYSRRLYLVLANADAPVWRTKDRNRALRSDQSPHMLVAGTCCWLSGHGSYLEDYPCAIGDPRACIGSERSRTSIAPSCSVGLSASSLSLLLFASGFPSTALDLSPIGSILTTTLLTHPSDCFIIEDFSACQLRYHLPSCCRHVRKTIEPRVNSRIAERHSQHSPFRLLKLKLTGRPTHGLTQPFDFVMQLVFVRVSRWYCANCVTELQIRSYVNE
jgi:hypothetical protein